jgi:hypothetical protein
MATTININACPCYNMHRHEWNEIVALPEGPIELYDPIEPGTQDLDADANFECEFRGEYPDMMAAIRDITGESGRFFWSKPDAGHYLGFLNHCPGTVALVVY